MLIASEGLKFLMADLDDKLGAAEAMRKLPWYNATYSVELVYTVTNLKHQTYYPEEDDMHLYRYIYIILVGQKRIHLDKPTLCLLPHTTINKNGVKVSKIILFAN